MNEKLKAYLVSHRKAFTAGALVIACAAAYALLPKTSGAAYITRDVAQGSLSVEVSANGTLEPTRTVSIGSELSGIVSEVLVDINDEVKAGDVLIKLNTDKLNAQVAQAEAGLESAKAKANECEVEERQAQAKYDRMLKLNKATKGRTPSKLDMDDQLAALDKAKAGVISARAEVRDAQATLDTQKTDLEKAYIRSSIDGMVIARSVEPGYAVAASLQAVELLSIASDIRKLELQIDVDEADVGAVKTGQKAGFTVSAYPNKNFPAKLTKVSYGSTTTNNVVTYTTYLDVDNADLVLRPGMTATARIQTDFRENAVLVPNMALRFTPRAESGSSITGSFMMRRPQESQKSAKETGGASAQRSRTVYVLEKGAPKAVSIVTGATNGTVTEVISGLKAGDKVIVGQGAAKK